MRRHSLLLAGVIGAAVFAAAAPDAARRAASRQITWDDVGPLGSRLEAKGIDRAAFADYVARLHADNLRRVREGDLDHLVFYLLQSNYFTALPPIEPALSARALVDDLNAGERRTFLATGAAPSGRIPDAVRTRAAALLRAIASASPEPRLRYFRELVEASVPARAEREAAVLREYLRVMRFVYEKEFVAQRAPQPAAAVADLYQTRGLSTDTAVEAGYLVFLGLGMVRGTEPDRRIRRVLIVGPGLDLAPRTGLVEVGPPESYQPWAVLDAVLGLGLALPGELEVVAADINPRVVSHLQRSRTAPPSLTLVSGIREDATVSLTADFRDYFAHLGAAISDVKIGSVANWKNGHLHKTVRVGATAGRALQAEPLDIVTERLSGAPFDLVIATNILPYFDDVGLMLALSNIAGMLGERGVFLHNEPRPLVQETLKSLGVPLDQSRHVAIANVRNAPAPLGDSVWIHRKR